MIANSLTIEGESWEIIEKSTQYWKFLGGGYLIEGKQPLRSLMPLYRVQ